MSKILFVSNIAKKINSFSLASISAAHECNLEFHMAANWTEATKEQIEKDQQDYNVKIHNIDLVRSPYSMANIKAYRQLVKLINDEKIDYIHCNTPVGGLLGRLAGKKCGIKKVIYQVHGFHFYKGASFKNWFIYYPVEKWLAHYTDALITINKEDFEVSKKLKLKNNANKFYVHGVGIDTKEYQNIYVDRLEKRKEINVSQDDFVFLSVGRLDTNKNNRVLIEAVAKTNNPKIKLVLCGDGKERSLLEELSKTLGVENQIIFLGNRTDMKEIYSVSDCLLMASFREGLSRTIMEAMSSGLPCVVSNIRGNVDLIEDGINGYLCNPADAQSFADAINNIIANAELREKMSKANLQKIMNYDVSVVEKEITEIYKEVLNIGV